MFAKVNEVVPCKLHAGHPAFKATCENRASDEAITACFAELDSIISIIENDTRAFESEIQSLSFINRNVTPLFKQIENNALASKSIAPRMVSVLRDALEHARTNFVRYLSLLDYRNRSNYSVSISDRSRRVCSDLTNHGVNIFRIDQEIINNLYNSIWPHAQNEMQSKNMDVRLHRTVSLPMEVEYAKYVHSLISDLGIIDGAKSFFGADVEYYYLCWQYSDSNEEWFKSPYANFGLPTSKAAYGHFDHDYQLLKAIIYLTDVAEDNGPFKFIPRDRDIYYGYRSQIFFYKYLDQALTRVKFEGIPAESVYYKKRYLSEQFRQEFMSLPSILSGSSHFGDEVMPQSREEELITSREIAITTEQFGNGFVFHGGSTFHRGGMVERGQRLVLQVGLMVKDFKG
jgi:hypothetical protein